MGGAMMGPHDIVGTTFFIACNMMLAFTLFFSIQVGVVPKHWRTSVAIAGLVCGVQAAVPLPILAHAIVGERLM